ncbi:hypothetical protein N7508_006629 [Penicillium antarcticum]|uniref:uncharacterized protein n=1 Tax=Penicillium antarcticum TaxID=416450 RepID=UPI0023A6271D|nr:uncharacterized protein N7508_006629 [Penicillium antarcticum]KAJ5301766.1 hypothetical protein N7508_006629 [Penicillium antarcticum]
MPESSHSLEAGNYASGSRSSGDQDFTEKFSLGRKGTVMFIALTILTLMVALDGTSISVALPIISKDLGATTVEAFWGGGRPSYCAQPPTFASLSNIFGEKALMLLALVFFFVRAAVVGASNEFAILLIGRCIQGVGGGGIISLAEIIMTDLMPLRIRGLYFAYLGSAWSVGSVIGPVLGGGFAQKASWRWIFYINLPLVGIGAILILIFLDLRLFGRKASSKAVHRRLRWLCHFLVPLVLGVVGLVTFVLYESYVAKDPMIPYSVFQDRTISVMYICTISLGLIIWCTLYYIPLYYEAVLGYDPIIAGVAMFPETFTIASITTVSAIIMTKIGRYRWAVWSDWMITVLGLGLLVLLETDRSIAQWVCLNLVPGIGLGLVITSMGYGIQAASSSENLPIAVAMFSFFRALGQALGVAIGEAIFQNRMEANLPKYHIPQDLVHLYIKNAASAVVAIKSIKNDHIKLSIQQAYTDSLRTVWISCCAIATCSFLLTVLIQHQDFDKKQVSSQNLRTVERDN